MEVKDLLIIYLAAGAPFAVYYFFRYRRSSHGFVFWLKLLFRFFVWFPYALLAAHRFLTPKVKKGLSTRNAGVEDPSVLKDEILAEVANRRGSRDFFEAREVLERYIALTNAKNNFAEDTISRENELFKIALRGNVNLAARCLHRKNREQVSRHQAQAQDDLYNLCSQNTHNESSAGKICRTSLALTHLLGDKVLEEKITAFVQIHSSEASRHDLKNYHLKPVR